MPVSVWKGTLRWWRLAAAVCLGLAAIGHASDELPGKKPPAMCSMEANDCEAPAKDLRAAASAYWRGVKLRDKDLARAYKEFTEAARLVPANVDYISARELARAALEQRHIENGNRLMAAGKPTDAVGEFRAALDLDSGNSFAQQRLNDALGPAAPELSKNLRLVERSDPVELAPHPGRVDIHYRGDSRGFYEMIARSFGIKITYDQSFTARAVRFEVEGVEFAKAMELAGMVTKSFWVPLSENEILLAADTPENRRQFEHLSLRSFYVNQASSPQELNDLAGMLRSIFELRLVSTTASKNLITVRAPRETLDAVTQFVTQLSNSGPPQVLLDIQTFEIDRQALDNLGIQTPPSSSLFNLSQVSALLASQPNTQQLINQLISSGGINQANSTALSALLAQLQQQQLSPLLNTPFATFGKGLTLSALTIGPTTAHFQLNSSNVRSLESMTLRAMNGKAATMKVGSRYPILNATFAPIFNSPAIAQNIQNNTFQAAFPSVSYEDVGLTVKATPSVHGESDVTLELEIEMKALTGQVLNGVPVISNRSYKSTITVSNGETAVVVGNINRTEQASLGGVPGVGDIPGLGLLAATWNRTLQDDELILVITPHIMQVPPDEPQAVWLPAGR
ncbi:MAG: type II and III secretion system protein [Terriglobales bacterium]